MLTSNGAAGTEQLKNQPTMLVCSIQAVHSHVFMSCTALKHHSQCSGYCATFVTSHAAARVIPVVWYSSTIPSNTCSRLGWQLRLAVFGWKWQSAETTFEMTGTKGLTKRSLLKQFIQTAPTLFATSRRHRDFNITRARCAACAGDNHTLVFLRDLSSPWSSGVAYLFLNSILLML